MKKLSRLVLVLAVVSVCQNAFALKQFNEAFVAMYVKEDTNGDFKKLVEDAKCNVCHVQGEKKKVRNVYGEALHEIIEADGFPVADFKKEPEKYKERVEELLKKTSAKESGDEKHKTFDDRMKANLLPGGTIEGKKE